VFLGEYQHSVDDKGRLVMPSKFRDHLAGGCVVTKGQEHCLYVFPLDRWEIEVERVNRLPRTNRRNRNYARSFFGAATDQSLDKQGRIQLPPTLRTFADLGKDVVVARDLEHRGVGVPVGRSRRALRRYRRGPERGGDLSVLPVDRPSISPPDAVWKAPNSARFHSGDSALEG